MKTVAYNSDDPGSMFEKPDGQYIDRDDTASLAGALLGQITFLKRQVEDLTDALAVEKINHKRTLKLLENKVQADLNTLEYLCLNP